MPTPPGPRPRLLVIASTYPRWRGDSLPPFVHELARRLTPQFEVHVLVPHTSGAATREELDGVEVHRFHYLPARFETLAYSGGMLPGLRRRPWRLLALPLFLMAEWWAALRLLRRQRFAAIHAHWLLPHGLIALMARALCGYRLRLVCTSHGADLYGLKGRFARSLQRRVIRGSTHVTVVSRAMLDTVRSDLGDSGNCSVLPMGVDTRTRFVPPAAGAPRSGILFVGRLADKKGVMVLLEAMARLRDLPEARLRIIGTGAEEAHLRRQASALDLGASVQFMGAVANPELPGWFQQSMVLAFPSIVTPYGDQEGLGLVPVESLACGCPVVASDLPAVRDVIRDGETGLLTPPGDADRLAETLRRLLRDPALGARLARQGRDYVQEHFDWEGIAQRYAALLSGGWGASLCADDPRQVAS